MHKVGLESLWKPLITHAIVYVLDKEQISKWEESQCTTDVRAWPNANTEKDSSVIPAEARTG